jgi:hypothetical protein
MAKSIRLLILAALLGTQLAGCVVSASPAPGWGWHRCYWWGCR